MEEIANLLRDSREESGIDLSEVSKDLGIDELILKNIEEGKMGAFKDVFALKNYISEYAKYLWLDSDKILLDFNEYIFEYTSKIPVEEIEKTMELKVKEDSDEISSPYTTENSKDKKSFYVLVYVLIFALVILTIFWSINQITLNKTNAYVVSYRKW